MLDFQETPLITSGVSLGLRGPPPLPEFKDFSSELLFFILYISSILFEYVESFIVGGMLISIGLIRRYHIACKMEAYDPVRGL
jgi:hypothetical protein